MGPQNQVVADGRDGHFVIVVGFVTAGQQAPQGNAARNGLSGQQLAFAVLQCHGVFGEHLSRDTVSQQPFHGVFRQNHPAEAALVVAQGGVQLQHSELGVLVHIGVDLAVDGLHQVAGQAEVTFCFTHFEHRASPHVLAGRYAGNALVGDDASSVVDPGQRQKLRILLHQGFSSGQKLIDADLLVRDIACQAHDLFLPLQQTQTQALLGIFHIPFDGFLLPLDLFDPQVPECAGNGGQKKHHSHHGGQVGITVLSVGRLAVPPRAPPSPRSDLGHDRCCFVQFHPLSLGDKPFVTPLWFAWQSEKTVIKFHDTKQ